MNPEPKERCLDCDMGDSWYEGLSQQEIDDEMQAHREAGCHIRKMPGVEVKP